MPEIPPGLAHSMKLKSVSYKESSRRNNANPWELKELILGDRNLIIGKNATGKTRIINVVYYLAKLIQMPQQITVDANWVVSFESESGQMFEFSLTSKDGKIEQEKISIDGEEKLNRSINSAQIRSNSSDQWQTISPPSDRLILHVRRDKQEFPFLENLISWAEGVRGFGFANTSPNLIEIPGKPFQLTSLNAVPSVLEQLSVSGLQNVLNQLNEMGYYVESALTDVSEDLPPTTKIVYLKERGIHHPLKQYEISQGMFRAFSLLTIIEFLNSTDKIGCILIDDLCEGLDYERSKILSKIIFDKKSTTKTQFITTSNDCFLTNSVSLDDLIICYRSNHIVKCLNYANSKQKFDSWQQFGLNNFDLLSSNFLLE